MLLEVLGMHPLQEQGILPQPPVQWWACTNSWKKADAVLVPEILRWIPKGALKRYDSRNHIIYLNNGSRIDILVYEQKPGEFASAKLNGIMLDEVQECKEEQWEECLVRLIDYHGRLTLNGTFVFGRNFIYDRVYLPWLEGDKSILWLRVSIHENPYIDEKEKEEALKGLDGDIRKVREFGGWIEFAGLIWPEFDRNTHCVPRFKLDWPIEGTDKKLKPTRYMAIDPMDRLCACLWIAVYPNGRVIAYNELLLEDYTPATLAYQIRRRDGGEIRIRWIDWDAWARDRVSGKKLAQELAHYGVRCRHAPKGPGSFEFGRIIVSEYLKRKIDGYPAFVVFDDMKNTIYQMTHYTFASSRKFEEGHNPSPKPKKKDDHLCDDVRWMLSTRPRYAEERGGFFKSPISGKTYRTKSPVSGYERHLPLEGKKWPRRNQGEH